MVVDKQGFPSDQLEITAESEEGYIMALKHKKFDIHGISVPP